MTNGELRAAIQGAPVYKMSLGKNAVYRDEALRSSSLVFHSERVFHDAVLSGNEHRVLDAGRRLRADQYPQGGAPPSAIGIWERTIHTFLNLPSGSLVLHWETELGRLKWGISGPDIEVVRLEPDSYHQIGYLFHRKLLSGWHEDSLGDIPLSDLHPKARDLAINQATLNRVVQDTDFFRALLSDSDTAHWEALPEWRAKAKAAGWNPRNRELLRSERRKYDVTPLVTEIADEFDARREAERMAGTALATAAYANGQLVVVAIKEKICVFGREELEDEIVRLLKGQGYRCALTGYDFKRKTANKHLKASLDRIDSSRGYVWDNIQVVTRAANFYKSASDAEDWHLKEAALIQMALAIQARDKAAAPTASA